MAEGLPVERLRAYLRDLPAAARALLAGELERGLLGGTEMPGTDLVLQELRAAMRGHDAAVLRVGDPARLFYKPLRPFLIDRHVPGVALPARVTRDALPRIWEWILRDLVAGPGRAYEEQAGAALQAEDTDGAARLARAFQVLVAQALGNLLATMDVDDKLRRRVIGQIGTPQAHSDIRTLFALLCNLDTLAQLAQRLPRHIGNMSDERVESVAALLHPVAQQNPTFLVPALVFVLHRLGASWQLIRLAVNSADSDVASRIQHAPLSPAVPLALAELRRAAAELREVLKDGRITDCIALLKEIHDGVRGIRTEMELGDSPWSRELAAIRAGVSDMLTAEIENMPGRVRRLLRPRPAHEIAAGSVLDPQEVADTETRIALVGACRNYAGELALNQVAASAFSDIQSQLRSGNTALLDALRAATEQDRRYRKSQLDAAVRFSGTLLGPEAAAMLAKAAASVLASTTDRRAVAKA